MQSPIDQPKRGRGGAFRVALTSLAVVTALVAAYVWMLMSLSVLSALEHGGTKVLVELGVDRTWAFALDSICLGLLISVILLRRDARLAPTGLAIAVLSFSLRMAEFQDAGNTSMFWFEPFLRSGVYALSFTLAFAANSFRRPAATT